MTSRERILAALECRPLDRPPIWFMRQAGRYLPEYRELKQQHGFLHMVKTPELAAEITLQPLKRFPLDAAILFSDILVVPEALGQPYQFRDGGGIAMDYAVRDAETVDRLETEALEQRLAYVDRGIRETRRQLGQDHALLGFVGSPWTLATYMVEGGSSSDFSAIKALFWNERTVFETLLEKITEAVIALCRLKIQAGVDALQIFDSWGAACPGHRYTDFSLRWIWKVIQALPEGFPIILYAKGVAVNLARLESTGARALSLDWTVDLPEFSRKIRPDIAVQGNLDPVLLTTEPDAVVQECRYLLQGMQQRPGYIFNLGHGVTPAAKIECVEAMVDTVVHSHQAV